MRQFLINTFKFIGLATLLYLGFMLIISSTTKLTPKVEKVFYPTERMQGSTYDRTRDLNRWLTEPQSDKPKVLLIGASSCYRNIDPEILDEIIGINSFNAGSAGMNTALEYHILESLTSNFKFDAVVLELCPLVWNLKRSSSYQDWIINAENPLKSYVWDITKGINRTKEYIYYTYRVVKHLNPLSRRNPRPYLDKKTKYISKGFDCIDEEPNYLTNYQDMNLSWSDENWEYLQKIIALGEERGFETIAISSPTRDLEYDLASVSELDITHLDFNQKQFELSWFQDELHMNCDGAHAYSEVVARELKKHFTSQFRSE